MSHVNLPILGMRPRLPLVAHLGVSNVLNGAHRQLPIFQQSAAALALTSDELVPQLLFLVSGPFRVGEVVYFLRVGFSKSKSCSAGSLGIPNVLPAPIRNRQIDTVKAHILARRSRPVHPFQVAPRRLMLASRYCHQVLAVRISPVVRLRPLSAA